MTVGFVLGFVLVFGLFVFFLVDGGDFVVVFISARDKNPSLPANKPTKVKTKQTQNSFLHPSDRVG